MRTIDCEAVSSTVERLFIEANTRLPADVNDGLKAALERETRPLGRLLLTNLLENARIAEEHGIALCQDCGVALVFIELGVDCRVEGNLNIAVNKGVRQAYQKGYLRKSMLANPLQRNSNTGDNTPAVIHLQLVPGDRLTIHVAPKGGGCENMCALWMHSPSAGREGIIAAIEAHVVQAGGKPCPPLVLGVGVGGTAEQAALLSKRALLRPLGEPNSDPFWADFEAEILQRVNATGVGPMGMGGDITALGVHAEQYPCHIASLPVALSVQCHAARHKTAVL